MPQPTKYNGTGYEPVDIFGKTESGEYEWISAEEQPNQTLREVDGVAVEWLFLIIYTVEMRFVSRPSIQILVPLSGVACVCMYICI